MCITLYEVYLSMLATGYLIVANDSTVEKITNLAFSAMNYCSPAIQDPDAIYVGILLPPNWPSSSLFNHAGKT